jgi:hypothetical protein
MNRITNDPTNHIYPYENGVDRAMAHIGRFFAGMTFSEFVREIAGIPDELADQHFRSQYITLCDEHGTLMMDFIGKFEQFETDIAFVMDRLGIRQAVPHLMVSHRRDYHEYYDETTRVIVAKRYARDIELFGYDF